MTHRKSVQKVRGSCGRTLSIAAGLILAAFGLSLAAEAAPKDKSRGYVVTWFGLGNYKGVNDCPDGTAPFLGIQKDFLNKLPKAEQARLLQPQNQGELFKLIIDRGPSGVNVCEHPESIADPSTRSLINKGDTAYGLNLTGTAGKTVAPNSCAHDKFANGLNGEAHVDNQLYRLTGCEEALRNDGPGGFVTKYRNSMMRDGNYTILIELRGVDDDRNDDNVEVGLYQSNDPMVKDASGQNILGAASLQVSDDPHYHNMLKGKIVDGVLTTEPHDIYLYTKDGNPMVRPEFHFRAARLRLELKPDGTAKGVLAGYHDWKAIYRSTSLFPGYCPSQYQRYKELADGYPDPKTGECTAISMAYLVEAIPAFVIHPDNKKLTNALPTGASQSGETRKASND